MSRKPILLLLPLTALVAGLVLPACSGQLPTTRFLNPRFDFAFVEKAAVLPLENLSGDRLSGERATRLIVTELLATEAIDVVEPGEVRAAVNSIAGIDERAPSTEHIMDLGRMLGVQAILVGSVTQSENLRSGALSIPVVTLDVHMLETETGTTVWAATHTEKGAGFGAKLLGTGAEPVSETTRRCVQKLIASLVN